MTECRCCNLSPRISGTAMVNKIAISARYEAARLSDRRNNLASLTRCLRRRTNSRMVVGEDQTVGEVTQRGGRFKRTVHCKEADQPQPLIAYHGINTLECGAIGAGCQVHAGDGRDPQRAPTPAALSVHATLPRSINPSAFLLRSGLEPQNSWWAHFQQTNKNAKNPARLVPGGAGAPVSRRWCGGPATRSGCSSCRLHHQRGWRRSER